MRSLASCAAANTRTRTAAETTISRTHVLGPVHDIAKDPVIRASANRDFPTWTPDEAYNAAGNPPAVRALQLRRGNPARARFLICSGQLGITLDDHVPGTIEEQTHLCFRNIGAVLKEASFTFADIVRINSFVVAREHLKGYMSVRDLYIADPPPASTLMIVSGFSRPEFLVEVEVIAAAP
jgi:2-iminobutanoate/2-iminopropanoate deaminase